MGYKKILTATVLVLILGSFFVLKKKPPEKTFVFWTIQLKAPVGSLIEKNIEIFKKNHPDYKVVWVDIPITEAKKRALASMLGKNPPDLINLNPEFSLLLQKRNLLETFDESETKNFNPELVKKLTYEGKRYALPFYATSPITLLNKEKFKNCNVEIKTYDDILKVSKCKNPPIFGINISENDTFSKIINKYDGFTDKEALFETYKLFYSIKEKNLLLKDTLTIGHREVIERYMSENAAFITGGTNFVSIIKQNAPDVYKNSIIKEQITGKNGKYDASLMNFVIPLYSKNKELSKEFALQLLSYENQMELAKKTNVLPANKKALEDEYFIRCSSDLIEKSRCIAAKQLKNLTDDEIIQNKGRELTEPVNRALEVLFLKGVKEFQNERLKIL